MINTRKFFGAMISGAVLIFAVPSYGDSGYEQDAVTDSKCVAPSAEAQAAFNIIENQNGVSLKAYLQSHTIEKTVRNTSCETFYFSAIRNKNTSAMKDLEELGFFPLESLLNKDDQILLVNAYEYALMFSSIEVIDTLKNHGGSSRMAPLLMASTRNTSDVIEALISQGESVSAKGSFCFGHAWYSCQYKDLELVNLNALYYAVLFNKNIQSVQTLVAHGAESFIENETGSKLIHLAAVNGSVSLIQYLINQGANISEYDYFCQPIHYAAAWNKKPVVEYLLSIGANVNATKPDNWMANPFKTPIFDALQSNTLDVVQLLISQGANFVETDNGQTALSSAIMNDTNDASVFKYIFSELHIDANSLVDKAPLLLMALYWENFPAADFLLNQGADPNATLQDGSNVFHYLYPKNSKSLDWAKKFIALGISPFNVDSTHQSPLHVACTRDQMDLCSYYLSLGLTKYINLKDDNGNTPLDYALRYIENLDSISLLLKNGATFSEGDFLYAAQFRNSDWLKKLIQLGAPYQGVDSDRENNALHLAAKYNRSKEVFAYLISLGFKVDSPNINGNTPLHFAAAYNNAEILKELILLGADPMKRDSKFEMNSLGWAAVNRNFGTVDVLLDFNFDVNEVLQYAKTPILSSLIDDFSSESEFQVIKKIISKGADIFFVTQSGASVFYALMWSQTIDKMPSYLSYFSEIGMLKDIKKRNAKDLTTPFDVAAYQGSINVMKFLIEKGGLDDINDQTNKYGNSPLMLHVSRYGGEVSVIDYLLSLGAKTDLINAEGESLLHLVAWDCRNVDSVKKIVSLGVDKKIKNHDEMTAYDIMVANNVDCENNHIQNCKCPKEVMQLVKPEE